VSTKFFLKCRAMMSKSNIGLTRFNNKKEKHG